MGIFDRAGRVLSSNFNASLESAEDPRKDLELTMREMREQLALAKRELVRAVAAERQLRKRGEEIRDSVERGLKRAELAVRAGDDALARAALTKKKQVAAEQDSTERLRVEQRTHVLGMKDDLAKMERTLRDFELRKGTIAVKAQQAKAGGGVEALGASGTTNAFSEFREMEDRLDGVDAVFEAQREVDEALAGSAVADETLEAKFAALEHPLDKGASTSELDEELASLKQRVRV